MKNSIEKRSNSFLMNIKALNYVPSSTLYTLVQCMDKSSKYYLASTSKN